VSDRERKVVREERERGGRGGKGGVIPECYRG